MTDDDNSRSGLCNSSTVSFSWLSRTRWCTRFSQNPLKVSRPSCVREPSWLNPSSRRRPFRRKPPFPLFLPFSLRFRVGTGVFFFVRGTRTVTNRISFVSDLRAEMEEYLWGCTGNRDGFAFECFWLRGYVLIGIHVRAANFVSTIFVFKIISSLQFWLSIF